VCYTGLREKGSRYGLQFSSNIVPYRAVIRPLFLLVKIACRQFAAPAVVFDTFAAYPMPGAARVGAVAQSRIPFDICAFWHIDHAPSDLSYLWGRVIGCHPAIMGWHLVPAPVNTGLHHIFLKKSIIESGSKNFTPILSLSTRTTSASCISRFLLSAISDISIERMVPNSNVLS